MTEGAFSMTVLHHCQSFPPEWSGGSTLFAVSLGLDQVRLGIRCDYLCGSRIDGIGPGELRSERSGDSVVTRVGTRRQRSDRINRVALRRRLRMLLADRRIDLIHVHSFSELCMPLFSAAREAKVPVVVTLHEGFWVCPNYCFENSSTKRLCHSFSLSRCIACRAAELTRRSGRARWPRMTLRAAAEVFRGRFVTRPLLERTDRIIGVCDYVVRQHRRFGVRHAIVTIPGLIADGEIAFKEVTSKRLPLRIGVLGAFREHKGGEIVLEAISLLRDRFSDFILDVWGPSPEPSALSARRELRGAPIVLHGFYQRSELDRIFASMDLMVHASTWDTYSTVILEALASRTPVLAVRATGTPEMVFDGKNGVLFRRNDAGDLARKIERILDCPEELKRMQRRMEPPLSYRTMSEAYAAVYRQLIEERPDAAQAVGGVFATKGTNGKDERGRREVSS